MKFINRCVVTLKPKSALIDWVNGLGVEKPEVWDFEGGAYLIDDHDSEEALLDAIKAESQAMLENELAIWTEDESQWPENRDYMALQKLFDLHIAVAGFDLSKEPLLRADVDDLI